METRFRLNVLGKQVEIVSPLLGRHQLRNLALAITAAEELATQGFRITPENIAMGTRLTSWPGRFQRFAPTPHRPEIIIDVAHNPAGAWALSSLSVNRWASVPWCCSLAPWQIKRWTRWRKFSGPEWLTWWLLAPPTTPVPPPPPISLPLRAHSASNIPYPRLSVKAWSSQLSQALARGPKLPSRHRRFHLRRRRGHSNSEMIFASEHWIFAAVVYAKADITAYASLSGRHGRDGGSGW